MVLVTQSKTGKRLLSTLLPVPRQRSTLLQQHSNVLAISHRRATGTRDPQHSDSALPCQGSSHFSSQPPHNYQIPRSRVASHRVFYALYPVTVIMCSSKAERRVPLPDSLVQALTLRHAANPDSLYLFPNKQGRPNGHFLRMP